MLHRAALGSLERFIGILLEHYSGALPPWLAPVQAVVIPVAPTFNDYAQHVAEKINLAGFRAQADIENDRMNAKIRKYQEQKVPYQLIVGQKEVDTASAAVRFQKGNQKVLTIDDFIELLTQKTLTRATDSSF